MTDLHEELVLLNENMNNQGLRHSYNQLIFYTGAVATRVDFAINPVGGKFLVARLNRFHPEYRWAVFLSNGTMEDVVTTLNSFGPFLPLDQIDAFWADVYLDGSFGPHF